MKKLSDNIRLDKALRGFIPVFGSDVDLRIMTDLGKLNKKLKSIDAKAFRELQEKRLPLTSKMREIEREEEQLGTRIIMRNFDF